MDTHYSDRRDAGRHLASKLALFAGDTGALVLALPPGGVPVGYEIAKALALQLDVFCVQAIVLAGRQEIVGVVTTGAAQSIDDASARRHHLGDRDLAALIAHARDELGRHERFYRDARPAPAIVGARVIFADDGSTSGSILRAAVGALRSLRPESITVVIPQCAAPAHEALRQWVDDIVCSEATPDTQGLFYDDRMQTSDDDVRSLLERARRPGFILQPPSH